VLSDFVVFVGSSKLGMVMDLKDDSFS